MNKLRQKPSSGDNTSSGKNHAGAPKAPFSTPPKYNVIQWLFKVLGHYSDFSGRARRREFWIFMLFIFLTAGLVSFLNLVGDYFSDRALYAAFMCYGVVMWLPAMAVAVRRLHDVGKSGWALLIVLIPIIGVIWLFALMVTKGQQVNNKYGRDPITSPESFSEQSKLKSVGVTMIVTFSITSIFIIFYRWIVPIILQGESFYQANSLLNLYFFGTRFFYLVSTVIFLITGFYLLNVKTISDIQEKKKKVMIMLLIASCLYFLVSCLDLIFSLTVMKNLWDGFMIYPIVRTLTYLSVVLLSGFIYFSQSKELIRKTAVTAIVFLSLFLLWNIYSQMHIMFPKGNHLWIYQLENILLAFTLILIPVALIVLAGTFLSKQESGEEVAE